MMQLRKSRWMGTQIIQLWLPMMRRQEQLTRPRKSVIAGWGRAPAGQPRLLGGGPAWRGRAGDLLAALRYAWFSRRRWGESLAGVAGRRRPEPVSGSRGTGGPPPGSRAPAGDRRRGGVPRFRATGLSARRHVVGRDLPLRQASGGHLVHSNLIQTYELLDFEVSLR